MTARTRWCAPLIVTLAVAVPARARAQERWLLAAEAPAAVAVTHPQQEWFSAGGLPGAALYRSLGSALLLGARLRAGVLSAGDSHDPTLMDKGAGGLASLTAAVRLRPVPGSPERRGTGLWLEVAAGGALTGRDLRPTVEVGAGWGFALGRVGLGPSVRYLQVVQPDDRLAPADAGLVLFGLELTVSDRGRRPAPPPPRLASAPRLAPAPRPPSAPRPTLVQPASTVDSDGDRILDTDDACIGSAEVDNGVDDDDGCPDVGLFTVIEDRIALDERVLFDTNRARVKRHGRRVLAAIVAYLGAHGEFERIAIEGHADARGPEDYNLRLSRLRAERVRRVLVELGVDVGIEAAGLGESQPRVDGRGDRAWQVNRRVELFLIRRLPVDAEVTP